MSRIAILGGGSWGTALAILFSRCRQSHQIALWIHDAGLARTMLKSRENPTYLPGQQLAPAISVESNMESVLAGTEIVVGAMPSAHARTIYESAKSSLPTETIIVSATKGLEPASHARMSEVILQTTGRNPSRIAVLSGPSFAIEAARGEPTAVVLACHDEKVGRRLQEELGGPTFRLYTNTDVLGVELAGAMKNVIAIAAGVCQGLGLGSNSLAALITRGLAEMSRLAVALGAKPETLGGLAGLGDLVLTCTGNLSRNRHVGLELGKGRKLDEILAGMKMVAEGVGTTSALVNLARENQIDLPITSQVNAILHEGKSRADAIREIMERPQKRE